MKIKRIKLYNCIGIKRGLGLDEIEINFEQFKPGLIGLFGKSGSGKSTLLNNLTPFRKDFKDNFEKDGYREFEFEFKGNHYLSQIYQNQAQIFKNDIPLNESQKISVYDEIIEKELCNEDTFYKLLFAGRRFKNIFDLTKGQRKELIVDYLLDYLVKYDEYQKKFKDEQNILIKDKERLEIKVEEKNDIIEKLQDLKEKVEQYKEDISTKEDELEKLEKEQIKYNMQQEKNDLIQKQIDEKRKEQQLIKEKKVDLEEQIEKKNNKIETLEDKWERINEKLKNKAVIDFDIDEIKEEKIKLQEQIDIYNKLDKEQSNNVKDITNEKKTLKNNVDDLQEDIDEKKTKNPPCTKDLQIKCPLTKGILYTELIEKLEEKLKQTELKYNEVKEKYDNLEQVDYDEKIGEIKTKIRSIDNKIEKYNKNQELKGEEKLKEEYKQQITELKEEKQVLTDKINNEIAPKIEQIKEEFNDLLEKIIEEYKDKKDDIDDYNEKIVRLEEKINSCKEQGRQLREKKDKLNEYEDKIENIKKDIIEYDLLIEFFGKTGGQLFDIELAGEEIAKVSNTLLENYSNKQIKIKFDTLKTDSKGQSKEIFDISCSINNGDWQTYLSDGETVLVSNAIREAMNYLKQTKDFKTVFIDELDGSIDSENRIGFLKLLTQGNALNDRQFTLLISHSEEVKGYVEQSINLIDNQILINANN